jgi:hypothetical protein
LILTGFETDDEFKELSTLEAERNFPKKLSFGFDFFPIMFSIDIDACGGLGTPACVDSFESSEWI